MQHTVQRKDTPARKASKRVEIVSVSALCSCSVLGSWAMREKRLRYVCPRLNFHGQMTAPRAVVKAKKASSMQLLSGWAKRDRCRPDCQTQTRPHPTFGNPLQRPSGPPAPQCRSRTCPKGPGALRNVTGSRFLKHPKHHGRWQRKPAPHQLPGRMELRGAQDALTMAILAASWELRRHGAVCWFPAVGTAFVARGV